jgi:hypothetical protein
LFLFSCFNNFNIDELITCHNKGIGCFSLPQAYYKHSGFS